MGRIYCDRTQSSVAMLTMLTLISGVTFFFLATILVTSKCSSVSDVEWNSLRDLYESTDGQNWDWRNENLFGPKWDFTYLTDPCNKNGTAWQGLQCSKPPAECQTEACSVTALLLPGYDLLGTLPTTFCNLTNLVTIDLSSSRINDEIPSCIGDMSKLLSLNIEKNCLTGAVPKSIGGLIALEELLLGENLLFGSFPSSDFLVNMTALLHVEMQGNALTGDVPGPIGRQWMHLDTLRFDDNLLSGTIPSSISLWTNLTYIDIDDQFLQSTLPPSIGQLTKLRILDIDKNSLNGSLPASLGNLSRVHFLYLSFNSFTGSIPHELGNLKLLWYFWAYENSLTGPIPSQLGDCSTLVEIYLYRNSLDGTLPEELSKIRTLSRLEIERNLIGGPLPEAYGDLNATTMNLHYNQFTGTIPSSWGRLAHVYTLSVHHNKLSGTIPQEIFENKNDGQTRPHLLNVYFNDNRLTGRIPSNICNANIMRQLYVFDNSLTGHLPSLDMCDNLQIFLLQNNRLSGRPDDTFGREGILGKLEAIDLSSNHFSGTVPSSLYRLPNLTYTSIVGNCFTGTLSDAICEAVRLDTLLLEGLRSGDRCRHSVWNPFSHMSLYYSEPIQGSIPDCVWEMSALTTLHISGNGLTGSIPAHNNLPRLADLSLGGNQLTGTIPDVILASVPYITCDLSSNRLKGGLSREYANNASGDENKKFTVDKNRLSGPIPDFIRRVTSLSVLAGNYFSCHHRDSLPPHDKYTESYVCGSDDLDVSLLLWLAIFCLVILLGVLAYSLRNVKGWVTSVVKTSIETVYNYFDRTRGLSRAEHRELWEFVTILEGLLRTGVVLMCAIVLLFSTWYLISRQVLKNNTQTYNYRYIVSCTDLTGLWTAVVMLVLLLLVITILYILVFMIDKSLREEEEGVCDTASRDRVDSQECVDVTQEALEVPEDSAPSRFIHFLRSANKYYALLVLTDALVLLLVKGSYVYFLTWGGSGARMKLAVQLLLSAFDISWKLALKESIRFLRKEGASHNYFEVVLYLTLLFFNGIVVPVLVTFSTDTNCFAELFVGTDTIKSHSIYTYCDYSFDSRSCEETDTFSLSSEYQLPFTYNFDCGSSVIKNFVPVFMLSYATSIVSKVLMILTAIKWPIDSNSTVLFYHIYKFSPKILWPNFKKSDFVHRNQINHSPSVIDAGNIVSELIYHILVMMTFGSAFPMLAFVVCFSLYGNVLLWKVLIGRFMEMRDHEGENTRRSSLLQVTDKYSDLRKSCAGVNSLPVTALQVVGLFSGLFFTLLLFDIAGDDVGLKKASLLVAVPTFLVPLAAYLCALIPMYFLSGLYLDSIIGNTNQSRLSCQNEI